MVRRKNNSAPFFSIVVPAYNCEDYIAGAIESVLSQGDVEVEVLVVDDGSTDGTCHIVRSLEEGSAGAIRLMRQENRGPGSARNRGIENAEGAYVLFLDADDRYIAGSFALLKSHLLESGMPNMTAFDFAPVKEGAVVPRSVVVKNEYPREKNPSSMEMLNRLYTQHFGYFSWCFAYKRDFLEQRQVRYPEGGRLLEDAVFLNDAVRKTDYVDVFQGDPIYLYTLRSDSISYTAEYGSIDWAHRAVMDIYNQASLEGLSSCCEVSLANLLYLRRLAKSGGHEGLAACLESDIKMVDKGLPEAIKRRSKDHIRVWLMKLGVLDAVEGFVRTVKRVA